MTTEDREKLQARFQVQGFDLFAQLDQIQPDHPAIEVDLIETTEARSSRATASEMLESFRLRQDVWNQRQVALQEVKRDHNRRVAELKRTRQDEVSKANRKARNARHYAKIKAERIATETPGTILDRRGISGEAKIERAKEQRYASNTRARLTRQGLPESEIEIRIQAGLEKRRAKQFPLAPDSQV